MGSRLEATGEFVTSVGRGTAGTVAEAACAQGARAPVAGMEVANAAAVQRAPGSVGAVVLPCEADVPLEFECVGHAARGDLVDGTEADRDRRFDIDVSPMYGATRALRPGMRGRVCRESVACRPMGRLGAVEDMVPLFARIASDESAFANGAGVSVDGGMTI